MIENTILHSARPSISTILLFVFVLRSNISTLRVKKILSLSINLKVITNKLSQHTMSDQYRSASKTPFKWYFAGGPTLARFFMFSFDVSFGFTMRRFFLAPKTYVKRDRKYNFTHHPSICPFVSPYNFFFVLRSNISTLRI